jgi:hypothetical protein
MRNKQTLLALSGLAFAWLSTGTAWAAAQTPVITGDRWMAYGIIGALILGVVIFVFASIGISQRDAAFEAGHKAHPVVPGIPVLGDEEDEDKD